MSERVHPNQEPLLSAEEAYAQGHYQTALKRYLSLQKSLRKDPVLSLRAQLGAAKSHHRLWHTQAAHQGYQEIASLTKERLGQEHSLLADALDGEGRLFLEEDLWLQAKGLIEEAHILRQTTLHTEHPDTAESLISFAELYIASGQKALARSFYEEAIRILRDLLGPAHPQVGAALSRLGFFFWSNGDYEQALTTLEEARKLQSEALLATHPSLASTHWNLALTLRELARLDEAATLLESSLRCFEEAFGLAHPKSYCALQDLGQLYQLQGRDEDAAALYHKAIKAKTDNANELKTELQEIEALARKIPFWLRGKDRKSRPNFSKLDLVSPPSVRHAIFAGNGGPLITTDNGVYLFDMPYMGRLREIKNRQASEAYLSPDHKLFYITSQDREISLWSERGEYQKRIAACATPCITPCLEAGYLVCGDNERLFVVSAHDGQTLQETSHKSDAAELLPLACAPNGELCAVGFYLGTKVTLYQLPTLEVLDTLETPEGLCALTFSQDGTLYAASQSHLYSYQEKGGEVITQAWALPAPSPRCIAAHPTEPLIALATKDSLLFFNTKTHQPVEQKKLSVGLRSMMFHPKKGWLLALDDEQKLSLWEAHLAKGAQPPQGAQP